MTDPLSDLPEWQNKFTIALRKRRADLRRGLPVLACMMIGCVLCVPLCFLTSGA